MQCIFDQLRIKKQIGKGVTSKVYKVSVKNKNGRYALKEIGLNSWYSMTCASQEKIIKLNNENLLLYKCVYVGERPYKITSVQDGEESRPGSAINEEEEMYEWNKKLSVLRDESIYNAYGVVNHNFEISNDKYVHKNKSVKFFLCTKHEKCRNKFFKMLKEHIAKMNITYLKLKNEKQTTEKEYETNVVYNKCEYKKHYLKSKEYIKCNQIVYEDRNNYQDMMLCYDKQKITNNNNEIVIIDTCKEYETGLLSYETNNSFCYDRTNYKTRLKEQNMLKNNYTSMSDSNDINFNINEKKYQISKYVPQKNVYDYCNVEKEISRISICYDEFGDIVFDTNKECYNRFINKSDKLYCYFLTEYCGFTLRDYIDLRNDVYFLEKKEKCDISIKTIKSNDNEDKKTRGAKIRNQIDDETTLKIKKAKKVVVVDAFGHKKKIRRDFINVSFTNKNKLNKLFIFILMKNILNGLLSLHLNNIIHGDLKPSNIFFDKNLTPKIGDFGLSYVTEKINDDEYFDMKQVGLIYFELLWPIKTVMERIIIFENIMATKELPPEFVKKHRKESKIIRKCLLIDRDKKITVLKLLKKLDNLYIKKNKAAK